MHRLSFDLKLVFLVSSNVCVLTWGATTDGIIALLVVAAFLSMTCAWYGLMGGRNPIVMGAVGGFAGAVVHAILYCALHGIGYFFYDGKYEYFEDGAFNELVIYPVVYLTVWGGIGLIIGIFCGAFVWDFRNRFLAD